MASAGQYQIAREKYSAAMLQNEVQQKREIKEKISRSQAEQEQTTQQIARGIRGAPQSPAAEIGQHKRNIAQQKLRWTESDYAENKLKILLHGFESISAIYKAIITTSAL
eukprot:gene27456-19450_t